MRIEREEGAAEERRRRWQSEPGGTGVQANNQGEPSTPLSSAPGGTGEHRRFSGRAGERHGNVKTNNNTRRRLNNEKKLGVQAQEEERGEERNAPEAKHMSSKAPVVQSTCHQKQS